MAIRDDETYSAFEFKQRTCVTIEKAANLGALVAEIDGQKFIVGSEWNGIIRRNSRPEGRSDRLLMYPFPKSSN